MWNRELNKCVPITWEIFLLVLPFQEHLYCQHFDHQPQQPNNSNHYCIYPQLKRYSIQGATVFRQSHNKN
jgi:hypothetical protein